MTCEELRPDYLLFAMGTMSEPESSELRAHLESGCAVCTEGLLQAQAMAYSMGAVLDGPNPPSALRGRVLAISGAESRRSRASSFWTLPIPLWQGWSLAAAALLLVLIPGLLWRQEMVESRAKQDATIA